MIGFGELRRLSLKWQTDIATVERAYALDWLLAGIFAHPDLSETLALRDGTALGKAYLPDYPPPLEADFSLVGKAAGVLEAHLQAAAKTAATQSGLSFQLYSLSGNQAQVEYTGPLGRRSAAQPHLPLRFYALAPRLPVVSRPLLHPFSDRIETAVRAISLTEMAAERLALLGQRPRVRDVYDLWFILARAGNELDPKAIRGLAEQIVSEKGGTLKLDLDPAYRPALEKAWENALKKVPNHPGFGQAIQEIASII